MAVKKHPAYAGRKRPHETIKSAISAPQSTQGPEQRLDGRKSGLDRLLDLLKIGLSLANIIIALLKH